MRFLGWFRDEERDARQEAGDRESRRQMMAMDGDPLWDEPGNEDGDDPPAAAS